MSTTRTGWKDIQRAADRLAELAREAGYPCPPAVDILGDGNGKLPTLYVERGSVTNGITAVLTWTGPQRGNFPIPGGRELARTAHDTYVMIQQRNAMLADLAYQVRNAGR